MKWNEWKKSTDEQMKKYETMQKMKDVEFRLRAKGEMSLQEIGQLTGLKDSGLKSLLHSMMNYYLIYEYRKDGEIYLGLLK